VTIICLGPLTNIARVFQKDADVASLVDRIIIAGGSINGIGNTTAAAEFNMFYDPASARFIFRSPTTKTLVPLDVTRKVVMTMDFLDDLPPETARAGRLLRKIVPYYFRAYHQTYAQESINLHRTMAIVAALHPEMFETREMAGDVEVLGELTIGATVFDRRHVPAWRMNMEVALEVDAAAARDCITRGLQEAGQATG
jgi:purine nucleosidase